MRQYIILACAFIALLSSLLAIFATIEQRSFQLRGYVDPTRSTALPFRPDRRLGVNAELTQYDSHALNSQLNLMRTAHITWVRQFFRWDEIEPQPGMYNWTPWDQIVDAFRSADDLKLVAVLMNAPAWAQRPGANDVTAPPEMPDDFGRFAHELAARYGDVIDYYQIWDEPNLKEAWGSAPPRPIQYLALLEAAYTAIHQADVGAVVISAALAPTTEQGPDNISDIRYLSALYASGARNFMDAVAAKPYGFEAGPDDRLVSENHLNFSRIISLREVMTQYGDGQKPLWASHWGWNSLPEDWSGSPSVWGNVSSTDQILYTLRALERAEREWPWLAGMILHHWQPMVALDNPQWGFSIVGPDGRPGHLYNALENRPRYSAATNGLFFATTAHAQYSGIWKFGSLGADIGWINDSQALFRFSGRDVALLLRKDNYIAFLYPLIDGQPPNELPRDSEGNAYIILNSPTQEHALSLVTVARDLPDTTHTLHIIADKLVLEDAQDRWALVGYAVSSGNLAADHDRQIAVVGTVIIISLVATIITARQIRWPQIPKPLMSVWGRLGEAGQLIVSALASIVLMIGMLLTWGDALPALFRREPVALALAFLTAGLVYIQPGVIITIVSVAVLFFIVYNRLALGLMLVILWSPFFLFPIELYRFAFPMSELLLIITSAAWILRNISAWARQQRSNAERTFWRISHVVQLTTLDVAMSVWLVASVVSATWTEWLPPAITDLRVMTIEPFLFYLIMRTGKLERKTCLRLVDSLLAAGVLVSLIGLWLFFQGDVITAEAGTQRLVSVYGSPNNAGLFLGRCIPFAVTFALLRLDITRRILSIISLFIMLLAVTLSQSAGALFVGIPLSLAAVLILIYRRSAILPIIGLSVVGAVASAIALQSARFARLVDFSSGTNFARIRVWQSALNIIRDHPFTGLGPDQFLYAFRGRYILPDAWQEPNLSHPHNFVLDFWVRMGISGPLIFAWIQLAFWRQALRLYHFFRQNDSLGLAMIIGIMGSMVNLLGHGLVDNSVFVQDLSYVFVLLVGLVGALSNTRAIDAETEKMV